MTYDVSGQNAAMVFECFECGRATRRIVVMRHAKQKVTVDGRLRAEQPQRVEGLNDLLRGRWRPAVRNYGKTRHPRSAVASLTEVAGIIVSTHDWI